MKAYLETVNEAGVVTCVVAAASIAVILLVAHAAWKTLTSELPKNNRAEQPPDPMVCDEPLIVAQAPSTNAAQGLRKELFLKNKPAPFKTILPRRKGLSSLTRWS
jgi:hypothetical protein